ncbi:MAG TPA: indole-3-glycerol phosphate synthase TrpC [Gemmatimonadaceae bacterium]
MPEAQATRAWTPPGGTLGAILETTRRRVESHLLVRRAALERAARDAPATPAMAAALRGGAVAVIAEVKRRSPSKGVINAGLSADRQAAAYVAGGARAISVLTESEHFGGRAEDLVAVRGAVRIPLLKKDFHVHTVQLVEARALGAAAVLLIARALPPAELLRLAAEAHALGLEVLAEVRDARELDVAARSGAAMIGVNNRDLETLAIDAATSERLLPLLPREVVAVAESGVSTAEDVRRMAAAGADAVLVGSSISSAADPASAVARLAKVERVRAR